MMTETRFKYHIHSGIPEAKFLENIAHSERQELKLKQGLLGPQSTDNPKEDKPDESAA